MSAFIVNDKTLNRILSFIDSWNFYENGNLKFRFWDLGKPILDVDEQEDILERIGLKIKELNAKAVNQRYSEDNGEQEFKYNFEKCDVFQAYNHLRCLTYQMNEGKIPEMDLYKLLEEIERQFEQEIAGEHPKVKSAEWEAE